MSKKMSCPTTIVEKSCQKPPKNVPTLDFAKMSKTPLS